MTTAALIIHRDAIAGPWVPVATGKWPGRENLWKLDLDNERLLECWEPSVRAAILDGELLSNVQFSAYPIDVGGGCNTLSAFRVTDRCKDSDNLIAAIVRPDVSVFEGQMELVKEYIRLRDECAPEVLSQLGWPYAFWWSVVNLHPQRTRYTLELLDVALRFALNVHMRFKHALHCPRPVVYSPQVQPIVLTPEHGSLPSGHATEAFVVATMLNHLIGADAHTATQLRRQAARIATNRVVAGVHFPVDSAAGRLLGETLAGYVVARCGGGNMHSYCSRRFMGNLYQSSMDADFRKDGLANDPTSSTPLQTLGTNQTSPSVLLRWLWDRAWQEWH